MSFNNPPWHPMSNPRELKTIGKLAEEVNELGAAIARCIIQGIDGLEPVTGKPNKQWLEEEIADVGANLELVVEYFNLDREFMRARHDRKIVPLRQWHEEA